MATGILSYTRIRGFEWQGRYYVYHCLLFGLKFSPRVFFKPMGVLVGYWRGRGVRMIAYLNDLFFPYSSRHGRPNLSCACPGGLQGRMPRRQYEAKSHLTAVSVLQHFGFVVHLRNMVLEMPQQRWD